MAVQWLEQTRSQMPAGDEWLSPNEIGFLRRIRFPKRHSEWRLGRWTAKNAVAAFLGAPADHHVLTRIELRSQRDGAPRVFVGGRQASVCASLSHRADRACCAVAAKPVALGCDLELIELRTSLFIADYFTAEEAAFVMRTPADQRSCIANLLWSAKESALKALGTGLRMDTRAVEIPPLDLLAARPNIWQPLKAYFAGRELQGWWRVDAPFVATLIADPLGPVEPLFF